MPSNARMTFRFEPKPAQKPVKPVAAVRPELGGSIEPIDARASEALPIASPGVAEIAPLRAADDLRIPVTSASDPNGPYHDDIRALEEMIRRTDSVVVHIPPHPGNPEPRQPAIQSRNGEEPQPLPPSVRERLSKQPPIVRELEQMETDHELPERWSLPDPTEGDRRATSGWLSQTGSYTRNVNPSWTRVALSVAAAIVTGAIFGYMVLTLFTGEPVFPSTTTEGQTARTAVEPKFSPETSSAPMQGVADDTGSPQASRPAASGANVPPDEAFVLQYGVFRGSDSTQLAATQLQDVGLPAAIDEGDGYRVYAGIAATKSEAEQLAAQMPNITVYIRPLEGAAVSIGPDERSQSIAAMLSQSSSLGRLISQMTVAGLNDKLPQPFAADDEQALSKAASDWQATLNAAESLNGKAQDAAKALEESLNAALQSLGNYAEKQSRYHLWHAQTAILQAKLADRDLRDALLAATSG